MIRQLRLTSMVVILLLLPTLTARAAIMTFNVDFFGVGGARNHDLHVFGTITVDPTMPVAPLATSSNLWLQHETDNPIALPSRPTSDAPVLSALEWNLSGNDLYISRTSTATEKLRFDSFGVRGVDNFIGVGFSFGSGTRQHRIDFAHSGQLGVDGLILKDASGPDGPLGFFVGTAVSIPEPTSAIFLAGLSAAFSMRRHRR